MSNLDRIQAPSATEADGCEDNEPPGLAACTNVVPRGEARHGITPLAVEASSTARWGQVAAPLVARCPPTRFPNRSAATGVPSEVLASAALRGRSLQRPDDLTPKEFVDLLSTSERLRFLKATGREPRRLVGKHIALVFEGDSTRTRLACEVAAHDQGAGVTYIGSIGTHLGKNETLEDTGRVLGRMVDGIVYRGSHTRAELLSRTSGIPLINAMTDRFHPLQVLADVLTISDHLAGRKTLRDASVCYVGVATGDQNVAESLMIACVMMGMEIRVATPRIFWPRDDIVSTCREIAQRTNARVSITESVREAVVGADFIYTDVWFVPGMPDCDMAKLFAQMQPYQVNARLMEMTGNPQAKFMHCLPAQYSYETSTGRDLLWKFGTAALEVTEEVFNSDMSIVFDQAENRLHTLKSILIATLEDPQDVGAPAPSQ